MKKQLSSLVALSSFCIAAAFTVDWNRIQFWTGEGENKAAIVVQFLDDGPEEAYVWGYRWKKDTEASGEDMFRAVAASSPDLTLFTQFTGPMGSTVCGIGYSHEHTISDYLEFDFDAAREDPNISFNWFSANTMLGQTSTPGWDTPDLCSEAIILSKTSHILDHPINAMVYGYACYDYDWWQPYELPADKLIRWNAGWYKGYWSYWCGTADSESFAYSGLGMSSRKLADGDVDGWKYTSLDGEYIDGSTGATAAWHPLNYSHFSSSHVNDITTENNIEKIYVYNSSGVRIRELESDVTIGYLYSILPKGLYIITGMGKTKKILID
ncbi:MAG: T9SS type A sorting domain-containing protein [Muribaculaceae bacterium]|nr:T9SS type A sorting domain-containing protein [Muribaculaceae bacterium]